MTKSSTNFNDTIILDCETSESILTSLENIFSTNKNEILSFIMNNNLDEIWRKSKQEKCAYQYYYEEFRKKFKLNTQEIEAFWFHNTRVQESICFLEGILPLEEAIPRVEILVDEIVADLGINHNSNKALFATIIQHKLNTSTDRGPWGFLIKDFAFCLPDGIHNYLEMPEIVEDVIRFKYNNHYHQIVKKYKEVTTPCIVKFKVSRNFHPDNLAFVIHYIYQKENKLELNENCNTNLSNCGESISQDMIIKINFYKNWKI